MGSAGQQTGQSAYKPQDIWGGIGIGGGGIPGLPGVPSWLQGNPVNPTGGGAAPSPLPGDLGASGGGSLAGSGTPSTAAPWWQVPGGSQPWGSPQAPRTTPIQESQYLGAAPSGTHWVQTPQGWVAQPFAPPRPQHTQQLSPQAAQDMAAAERVRATLTAPQRPVVRPNQQRPVHPVVAAMLSRQGG